MGRKRIDLTGQKINHLEFIKLDHVGKNKTGFWLCKCDCGNYKVINANKVRNGSVKGCGCLRGKNQNKYEIANKKLYKRWWHMINRCFNPKDISYKNYGERGITVCEEWKEYDNFAKWSLENGYSEQMELDRINNNGNYEPSNCRYTTRIKNANNKRTNIKYNYNNQILTLKEIADLNNINYKILWQRIKRDKKTLEEALEVK